MSTHIICNGEFEIVRITADLYDEVEALHLHVFLNFENICLATKVKESPLAIEELKVLLYAILDDGISFAARHRTTGEIAGICCNKILNKKTNLSLDSVFGKFTTPNMICIDDFLTRMETTFDIYKEWQVESIFEIEFLAVHPKWVRRGLAFALSIYTVDFARQMSHGLLSKDLLDQLPEPVRNERPQATMAVFTTIITQKIGQKLNMVPLVTKNYTEFSFEGTQFTERVDPHSKYSQYCALRL